MRWARQLWDTVATNEWWGRTNLHKVLGMTVALIMIMITLVSSRGLWYNPVSLSDPASSQLCYSSPHALLAHVASKITNKDLGFNHAPLSTIDTSHSSTFTDTSHGHHHRTMTTTTKMHTWTVAIVYRNLSFKSSSVLNSPQPQVAQLNFILPICLRFS